MKLTDVYRFEAYTDITHYHIFCICIGLGFLLMAYLFMFFRPNGRYIESFLLLLLELHVQELLQIILPCLSYLSILDEQLTILRSNATKVLVCLSFHRAVWSSCILCACGLYFCILPCTVYFPGFSLYQFSLFLLLCLIFSYCFQFFLFSFLSSMDLYISVVGQTTPNETNITTQ